MNKLDYLKELRDILKNCHDNGGIESVNFVTQGGGFYFEKNDEFLEVVEELDNIILEESGLHGIKC